MNDIERLQIENFAAHGTTAQPELRYIHPDASKCVALRLANVCLNACFGNTHQVTTAEFVKLDDQLSYSWVIDEIHDVKARGLGAVDKFRNGNPVSRFIGKRGRGSDLRREQVPAACT